MNNELVDLTYALIVIHLHCTSSTCKGKEQTIVILSSSLHGTCLPSHNSLPIPQTHPQSAHMPEPAMKLDGIHIVHIFLKLLPYAIEATVFCPSFHLKP